MEEGLVQVREVGGGRGREEENLGEELLRPGDLHYKAYVGHPTM